MNKTYSLLAVLMVMAMAFAFVAVADPFDAGASPQTPGDAQEEEQEQLPDRSQANVTYHAVATNGVTYRYSTSNTGTSLDIAVNNVNITSSYHQQIRYVLNQNNSPYPYVQVRTPIYNSNTHQTSYTNYLFYIDSLELGYTIDGWSWGYSADAINTVITDSYVTFDTNSTPSDVYIKANVSYTPSTYTATITAGTGGSVNVASIANISSGTSVSISSNTLTINGTTVTATPSTGYYFSQWYDTTNSRVLANNDTITGDISIQAQFVTGYTATITAGTGGTVSAASVSNIEPNSSMTIAANVLTVNNTTVTATASAGYAFTQWYDTTNSRVLSNGDTITGNITIQAQFGTATYTVSLSATNGGTVSQATITNVPYGSSITIQPVNEQSSRITINGTTVQAVNSNLSYAFTQWYDSTNLRVLSTGDLITGDTSIQAQFGTATYTVSFTAGTGGTVSPASIGSILYGATITISSNTLTINGSTATATPSAGYSFSQWYDVTNSRVLANNDTVPGNITIQAQFIVTPTYTATITAGTGGTVSAASIASIPSGSSMTIAANVLTVNNTTVTATASAGYAFTQWYDTTNSRVLTTGSTVTGNITIQAQFDIDLASTHTVSFTANNGGTVSQASIVNVPDGSTITIQSINPYASSITINGTTVTAIIYDTDYNFTQWYDLTNSRVLANNDTITSDITIQAQFSHITYTVSFTTNHGATLSQNSITNIPYGSTITIVRVDTWTSQITINNTTVTASNSDPLYEFLDWYNTTDSVSVSDGDIVTKDLSIVADYSEFAATTVYVEVSAVGCVAYLYSAYFNMTVHATAGHNAGVWIPVGTSVTFRGDAGTGYSFYQWQDHATHATLSSSNPYSVTINSNTYVDAVFTQDQYTVSFTAGTGGSVSPASIANITYGTPIALSTNTLTINGTTVTATPSPGYGFTQWYDTTNSRVLANNDTVTGSITVQAQFSVIQYTVGLMVGYSGCEADLSLNGIHQATVEYGDPAFSMGVSYGDSITVTATAGSNWTFSNWVNYNTGVIVSSNSTYTFSIADSITLAPVFTYSAAVYWSNSTNTEQYHNGLVDLVFDMSGSGTMTHSMSMSLYTPTTINGSTTWAFSGKTLIIDIRYQPNASTISASVVDIGGNTLVTSSSVSLQSWSKILVSINSQDGHLKVTPLKSFNSFFDYTLYENLTLDVLNFSNVASNTAIERIGHNETGSNATFRFSVVKTSVFLDTYGVVLVDPSINVHDYFPQYSSVRLNFYSFAAYGQSMTINGTTFDVVDGKITVDYRTDNNDENYLPNLINGTTKTRTFSLTNIYITWDGDTHQVSLTFVNDRFTINLGAYASGNETVSFAGTWYFSTQLFEPITGSELQIGEWKPLPDLDKGQIILIFLGCLILAGVIAQVKFDAGFIDMLIIGLAGLVGLIML